MSLDDYLHQFGDHHRITLIGPLLSESPYRDDSKSPVIWVDGGANHRGGDGDIESIGFAVGDGDSARVELDQYLDVDKDYSDLAYVLRRLPTRFTEVRLRGFLGARRDHELFNLGEVHHFLTAAKTPTRVYFDDAGITAYSKGEWVLEAPRVFSLAVIEATTVRLLGACKFPLNTPTKIAPLTSFGLSNQGFGAITLITQGPAFIIVPGDDALVVNASTDTPGEAR